MHFHASAAHADAIIIQSIVGEELAQGPYVAARVGFQLATLRIKGDESTNEPSRLIFAKKSSGNFIEEYSIRSYKFQLSSVSILSCSTFQMFFLYHLHCCHLRLLVPPIDKRILVDYAACSIIST